MVETQAHPVGSTGNISGTVQHTDGMGPYIAVEFTVEAVGGTPTVTWQVEGSLDNTNWTTLALLSPDATVATSTAPIVATTVSKVSRYLDGMQFRWFNQLRVRTSANTNVTFSSRFMTPASGIG